MGARRLCWCDYGRGGFAFSSLEGRLCVVGRPSWGWSGVVQACQRRPVGPPSIRSIGQGRASSAAGRVHVPTRRDTLRYNPQTNGTDARGAPVILPLLHITLDSLTHSPSPHIILPRHPLGPSLTHHFPKSLMSAAASAAKPTSSTSAMATLCMWIVDESIGWWVSPSWLAVWTR